MHDVITTANEAFTPADARQLAGLIYKRFGYSVEEASAGWARMLRVNITPEEFARMLPAQHATGEVDAEQTRLLAEAAGTFGKIHQRRRLDTPGKTPLGMLPEAEALDVMRDGLLEPLASLERFHKIGIAEVAGLCQQERHETRPDVAFTAEDTFEPTPAERRALERAEALLPRIRWQGHQVEATATLRRRRGTFACGKPGHAVHVVERAAIRVEVAIDGLLSLSREYSAR